MTAARGGANAEAWPTPRAPTRFWRASEQPQTAPRAARVCVSVCVSLLCMSLLCASACLSAWGLLRTGFACACVPRVCVSVWAGFVACPASAANSWPSARRSRDTFSAARSARASRATSTSASRFEVREAGACAARRVCACVVSCCPACILFIVPVAAPAILSFSMCVY